MRLHSIPTFLLAAVLTACGSSKYQKNDTGITVNVAQQQDTDVRKVRLQVFGDKSSASPPPLTMNSHKIPASWCFPTKGR